MRTIALNDFFGAIGYDWRKDEENIKTICYYTKTRVDKAKYGKDYTLGFGAEQTFLLKAVTEWINATNFFEIGTGRGTACYAVSLVPSVQSIHTVDILNFKQKFATAIGHKPASVSLADIREKIPFKEKSKVSFHHRSAFANLRSMYAGQFDLAFIDGDHTSGKVILEDYSVCKNLLNKNGIILWDDYDPDQFAVKGIVDNLLKNNKNFDALLVEQRGHLFKDKPAEKDRGVVIMKSEKIVF